MEYEIDDDPQGGRDSEDSETVRDHRALQNQSSVKPSQYPAKDRKQQGNLSKSE
jgi:hypothetical protein